MSETLLLLLQLCNSSFPLGAYSYSEGLETLVLQKSIVSAEDLTEWLTHELQYGTIRIDGAILLRAYDCYLENDHQGLYSWNNWLIATRETEELRQQNRQMGKSLCRLLSNLIPDDRDLQSLLSNFDSEADYTIAFAILTAYWQIDREQALLGYLHSWLTNLINIAVKLIPLGQTQGQKLLLNLNPLLVNQTQKIMQLQDEELSSCSWGLSRASMNHEILYSRLFRS